MIFYKAFKEYSPNPKLFVDIKKGEEVEVVNEYTDNPNWKNWILCIYKGKECYIPKQYLNNSFLNQDYNSTELRVSIGDIFLTNYELNGFIHCINIISKEVGWVPLDILEIIKDNKLISIFEATLEFNNEYKFKILNISDIDKIIKLQENIISKLNNKELLKKTSKEDFIKILNNDSNFAYGVFYENDLVGYTFLTIPKSNFLVFKKRFKISFLHKKNLYFKVVVIDELHRGKGINRIFIDIAFNYGRLLKYNRILATVSPLNVVSNKLFTKYSFKLVKTTNVHNNELRNIYEYKIKKRL